MVGPDQPPLDAILREILSFVEMNFDGPILDYRSGSSMSERAFVLGLSAPSCRVER